MELTNNVLFNTRLDLAVICKEKSRSYQHQCEKRLIENSTTIKSFFIRTHDSLGNKILKPQIFFAIAQKRMGMGKITLYY
jgi:hypothetical protein